MVNKVCGCGHFKKYHRLKRYECSRDGCKCKFFQENQEKITKKSPFLSKKGAFLVISAAFFVFLAEFSIYFHI